LKNQNDKEAPLTLTLSPRNGGEGTAAETKNAAFHRPFSPFQGEKVAEGRMRGLQFGSGTMSNDQPRTRKDRHTEPVYALDFRRDLREASTKAEQLVWAMIRDRRMNDAKFRRQHSVGRFIVDFVCLESKLVIELDGGYHDYTVDEDKDRESFIKAQGLQVLRFCNEDVLKDADAVARAISNTLRVIKEEEAPSP